MSVLFKFLVAIPWIIADFSDFDGLFSEGSFWRLLEIRLIEADELNLKF